MVASVAFEQAIPPGRFLLACIVEGRGFTLGERFAVGLGRPVRRPGDPWSRRKNDVGRHAAAGIGDLGDPFLLDLVDTDDGMHRNERALHTFEFIA